MARSRRIAAVADGSNADDRGDYRPGRQAAREFGVLSPLDEAGLTKDEIRELARPRGHGDLGRARVGVPVVENSVSFRGHARKAASDRSSAERVLGDLGFRVFRVRHHDAMARLELGRDEMASRARS